MMLYRIRPKLINKVVGYVASNKMVEGYMYNTENSVYKLNVRGKLEFTPDIDAIEILKRAKMMDIIVSVPIGSSHLIISDKLTKTILNHTIPIETQIFDAYALYKDKKYHYNFLYIYDAKENEIIDWQQSAFVETSVGGTIIGEPMKYSFEDFTAKKMKEGKYFNPNRLVLKLEKINTDIFRLDHTFRGYYVSEDLKNAIEEVGCQGVDLIPIDQLGFEVEFI
ncbi:hypothetical protein SAMN04487906_0501 [Zhouia amylolytica]|uniref:Uncharacterized protein n=1 Tax=Zhouia amylolytica TaxID=376730 RepID=A0A1I6PVP8_9FLAO|nr:hypothetical protein [Zhouia amylolytica]SFS44273.1 hypothetical protein SAMN04487906_0501 [Zhouia amylolytica]